MKGTKRTLVVLSLVLITAGTSRATENKEDISGTMKASCLIQLTSDPAVFPVNWQTIEALVDSSGVGGKAAGEILEISPDQVSDIVVIEILESRAGVSPQPARGLLGGAPTPTSRSRTTKSAPGEDTGMDEYFMMEEYGMEGGSEYSPVGPSSRARRSRTSSTSTSSSRSRSSYSSRSSTTVRRPGESTAAYVRRRAEAATRARATAAARSRTPQRTPATGTISAVGQTTLLRLTVELPDEAAPAAKEFVSALVENLRHVLLDAYDAYVDELRNQLNFAEHQRDVAEARLAEATLQVEIKGIPPIEPPMADVIVHDRLEAAVDVSNLSQAMSFEEVVKELENAVEPPVQIQPKWKNLLEKADIEPTTPALMDPLTGVKLRKALELLLDGVSSDKAELGYVVDEGVIVIATEDELPRKMVTHVYEIPALAHSHGSAGGLVQTIQESVEPDSWLGNGALGEGTISVSMGNKLAIYQTYEVHKKINKFLDSMMTDIPASTPSQVPPDMLLSEKRDLLREKQGIEMEITRLEARQEAIEKQIVQIKDQVEAKIQPDPVIDELQKLIAMHTEQLAVLETQRTGKNPAIEYVDIKEKLARARIDLAKRRQQLSLSAGGDRVQKYNAELADLTIELAEKTAALNVLNDQLGQTENQLAAATMIDPKVSKIRTATQAFERADQRVNELNARLVNLRPPTVSVLGGR